jgi:hypothetical protein
MAMSPIESRDGGIAINVWVVAGASTTEITGVHGNRIKVRTSAKPEAGKANAAVQDLLSRTLGVSVELVRGINNRGKMFQAVGIDKPAAEAKLGL